MGRPKSGGKRSASSRGRGGGGSGGRGGGSRTLGTRPRQGRVSDDEADGILKLNDDSEAEAGSNESGNEEDVLTIGQDDADQGYWEEEKASKADDARVNAGSVGWQGKDFYGGDDMGDDSDNATDEELILEEAQKLEELRALRLQSSDALLGALVGPGALRKGQAEADAAQGAKPAESTTDSAEAAFKAVAADAQFESVFASKAETGAVQRDLSQLSEGKRRGLMRKEAPELQPLLEDFKVKLANLHQLLPALAEESLAKLPETGANYLRAKASLLLSTLANLSFYLLLRSEGGAVRGHPVVPQLVWLRELNERLAPLDKRLGPKLRKTLRAISKATKSAKQRAADRVSDGDDGESSADVAASKAPAAETQHRRLSLRERLSKLELKPRSVPDDAIAGGGKANAGARRAQLPTADLLRLPKGARRRAEAGDAPLDLDEVDPILGAWRPGATTLHQQLSSVQQQLGEQASKSKVSSADTNVEARQRRGRTRLSQAGEEPDLTNDAMNARLDSKDDRTYGTIENSKKEEEEEEDELVRKARQAAREHKEQRAARKAAQEEDSIRRQHRPEEVADGRRKTAKKILDNRGLVRVRKKTAGNARVSNRKKYDKALKKRRALVQEMREGAPDGATYEGEATGIRTHVRKSLKLA